MTWHLTPRSFFLVHVNYVTTTSSVVCVYNSPLNRGFNQLLTVWLRVTSITIGDEAGSGPAQARPMRAAQCQSPASGSTA